MQYNNNFLNNTCRGFAACWCFNVEDLAQKMGAEAYWSGWRADTGCCVFPFVLQDHVTVHWSQITSVVQFTRSLQIFYHRKTKRRRTDSLRGTSVSVFQHMAVFALKHDFAFNVTEDKLNYLAHHLHVQHFKIILPTMENANACSNRTGFVMLVMPVNDNVMLGKWNSACGSSLVKDSSHMCWIPPSVLEDALVEEQEPLVSSVWWVAEATVAVAVFWDSLGAFHHKCAFLSHARLMTETDQYLMGANHQNQINCSYH